MSTELFIRPSILGALVSLVVAWLAYRRDEGAMTLEVETSLPLLTPLQVEAYQRDGYIVLSGLLNDEELEQMRHAGSIVVKSTERPKAFFAAMEQGIILGGLNRTSIDTEDQKFVTNSFRQVALHSKIPRVAAELMKLDPSTQNLRVLREVFLGKSVDNPQTCDWHVDDPSFWPESYHSSATEESGIDQSGVNAWVAMDDMPAIYSGSMAVAAGSHRADWKEAGYEAIGQDHSNLDGFEKEAMFQWFKTNGILTCTMNKTAPDLFNVIEKTKKIFDFKKGDVLFHTRFLFHRTTAVTEEGIEHYKKMDVDSLNRYSIRYATGSARLPRGYNSEWSILSNQENSDRTLDEVDANDGGWYPVVWPEVNDDVYDRFDLLVSTKLIAAKAQQESDLKELFKILSI